MDLNLASVSEILGISFKKKKQSSLGDISGFSIPIENDVDVYSQEGGLAQGSYNLSSSESAIKNDNDLILKYRTTALYSDCDKAINIVTNATLIYDETEDKIVSLKLKEDKFLHPTTKKIQRKLAEEFQNILKVLEFNKKAPSLFRNWYVDGKLYHEPIFDKKNPRKGILDVRQIDPLSIKRAKHLKKTEELAATGAIKLTEIEKYYIYSPGKIINTPTDGDTSTILIKEDNIIYTSSGLYDRNEGITISHLRKAVRPYSNLRDMENAQVVYRVTRSPERRVFYIDVGSLPKTQAEQSIKEIANKFKTRTEQDPITGEIRTRKNHLAVTEDIFLSRREGQRATEIVPLPSATNVDAIEDITYFQNKLYDSLNVPKSRLKMEEHHWSSGRSGEIMRDEVEFEKFIKEVRQQFSTLLLEFLRFQLLLKNIISYEDWDNIKNDLSVGYNVDNQFYELAKMERLTNKIGILASMDGFVGKYFSREYVYKTALGLTDMEIKEMERQMEKEKKEKPQYFENEGDGTDKDDDRNDDDKDDKDDDDNKKDDDDKDDDRNDDDNKKDDDDKDDKDDDEKKKSRKRKEDLKSSVAEVMEFFESKNLSL